MRLYLPVSQFAFKCEYYTQGQLCLWFHFWHQCCLKANKNSCLPANNKTNCALIIAIITSAGQVRGPVWAYTRACVGWLQHAGTTNTGNYHRQLQTGSPSCGRAPLAVQQTYGSNRRPVHYSPCLSACLVFFLNTISLPSPIFLCTSLLLIANYRVSQH